MTMSREDGDQQLQGIQLHLPPGLQGMIPSVTPCGEPQADEGTCGPASLIGETTVSVGLGGDPFTVTGGKVYHHGPLPRRAVRAIDREPREGWPVRPREHQHEPPGV